MHWRKRLRIAIQQAAIVLGGGLLVWLFLQTPLNPKINQILYDILLNQVPMAAEESRVVILGIDDRALKEFKEPMVLWHRYLSTAIDAASQAGARAVGFDFIPAISLQSIAPELERMFYKALRQSVSRGTRILLGYDAGQKGAIPHRKYIFAASGLGYLNLWPDDDGITRSYRYLIRDKDKDKTHPSIALALVSKVDPDRPQPQELPAIVDYRRHMPPIVNFSDVFDRANAGDQDWLRQRFQDKIVIIGVTSFTLHDHHRSPIWSGDKKESWIPGVLIHGMAVNNLYTSDPMRMIDADLQHALSVLLWLLSALTFLYLPPLRATLIQALVLTATFAGVTYAYLHFLVVPIAPMLAPILLPALLSGTYRYAKNYRQFHQLQRYFKSYVNEDMMISIIQDSDDIGFDGKKTHATVMFTDIRSFTTLSESLEPEQVVQGLNRYFKAMTHEVIQSGGYLNRYLGDGILAIFGAPRPLPTHGAMAAIRCALAMQASLDELNRNEHLFPNVDQVRIGIGIHTGPAIVGNIGCDEKMDYSIIGDTVNLASRIESQTKSFGVPILISQSTYELCREQIIADQVAETQVKGREQAVKLYSVSGLME